LEFHLKDIAESSRCKCDFFTDIGRIEGHLRRVGQEAKDGTGQLVSLFRAGSELLPHHEHDIRDLGGGAFLFP
jgi:hypothetical protein